MSVIGKLTYSSHGLVNCDGCITISLCLSNCHRHHYSVTYCIISISINFVSNCWFSGALLRCLCNQWCYGMSIMNLNSNHLCLFPSFQYFSYYEITFLSTSAQIIGSILIGLFDRSFLFCFSWFRGFLGILAFQKAKSACLTPLSVASPWMLEAFCSPELGCQVWLNN